MHKTIFFDMGNTLLHFHHGMSDAEKDRIGFERGCFRIGLRRSG